MSIPRNVIPTYKNLPALTFWPPNPGKWRINGHLQPLCWAVLCSHRAWQGFQQFSELFWSRLMHTLECCYTHLSVATPGCASGTCPWTQTCKVQQHREGLNVVCNSDSLMLCIKKIEMGSERRRGGKIQKQQKTQTLRVQTEREFSLNIWMQLFPLSFTPFMLSKVRTLIKGFPEAVPCSYPIRYKLMLIFT